MSEPITFGGITVDAPGFDMVTAEQLDALLAHLLRAIHDSVQDPDALRALSEQVRELVISGED